jgi:hypothetical protein
MSTTRAMAGQADVYGQQLADGTVIWTSPTGQTYTTHPGSAPLFPTLATPTAPAPLPDTPHNVNTDRGLMMPKRRRTRAQDRAHSHQSRNAASTTTSTTTSSTNATNHPPF